MLTSSLLSCDPGQPDGFGRFECPLADDRYAPEIHGVSPTRVLAGEETEIQVLALDFMEGDSVQFIRVGGGSDPGEPEVIEGPVDSIEPAPHGFERIVHVRARFPSPGRFVPYLGTSACCGSFLDPITVEAPTRRASAMRARRSPMPRS